MSRSTSESDASVAAPDDHAGWRPRHNPWAVAFTVTLATFMEVLDTAIANVALPHIAGGLSASRDEATWVLTSYLVSNAVVLPISAWISSRAGRKRFYMSCVVLFTLSSFLCGFAPSLSALVFFRVLQGIGGGGLAPSEQAILADTFPPAQRGMAFAMYGLAVVLAPAIGPTLGGYIVDHTSWRWIFYINVPVGLVSLLLSSVMVEDPPWLREEKERSKRVAVDWLGLGLVAVAFGSLQVILDKGQEDDWFSSPMIVGFTMAMVICMLGMLVWEAAHPNPIVNIRLFRNRNFATSVALMFTLGAVLYGTTVLIPLFLQTLMGYSAQSAGEVLSMGGLVTMAMMPVVGVLVSRVPAKYLIAPAFSGMMNLARNIGGSVGIAFITTMLARRSQTFQTLLVGHASGSSPYFQERLSHLQRAFSAAGPAQALRRAFGALYATVQQQAALLSYVSIIRDLAVVCAVFVPLILLGVKRNAPSAAGA